MEIKVKIWLEQKGEVVAGGGKIRLLKLIERHGSIQKAAHENGMSYRHAWGALRKMEMRSGMRLVETRAGGRAGGGAGLTEPARDLVARYEQLREGLAEIIQKKFRETFGEKNTSRERKKPGAGR